MTSSDIHSPAKSSPLLLPSRTRSTYPSFTRMLEEKHYIAICYALRAPPSFRLLCPPFPGHQTTKPLIPPSASPHTTTILLKSARYGIPHQGTEVELEDFKQVILTMEEKQHTVHFREKPCRQGGLYAFSLPTYKPDHRIVSLKASPYQIPSHPYSIPNALRSQTPYCLSPCTNSIASSRLTLTTLLLFPTYLTP